ncbi:MAG: VWA domain-containing protein [Methylococcales bacterium]|nr:VWA domain-containing protein [Methylococcales bacterium]
MKRLSFILALIIFSPAQVTLANEKKPLLMKNKKNLYQRVLTLPEAKLYSQANASQQDAKPLPVFTVYYVYSRKTDGNNQTWVQVGLSRYGSKAGWIKAGKTLDWSQRLTLTFREPVDGQDRVLLFKDRASAEKLATSSDLSEYNAIYKAASTGADLPNSPVVAIQPAKNIDIRKNFYLIPIHTYEDIFMRNSTARLLQVSSIPIKEGYQFISKAKQNSEPKQQLTPAKIVAPSPVINDTGAGNEEYSAGITFVIDATLSMQPYIDRTRQAVGKIFNDIKDANLLGNVNFGLVAYRDNIAATPKVEYVTKQFVSLKEGKDSTAFMNQVTGLQATQWSTKNFREDGFAGVHRALQEMDWSPYAARYIVVITDASSRDANDPLSSTGIGLAKLKKLAQEKNIAIFVMHLLSSGSRSDHSRAKKQYEALSEYPSIGSFYYGVPTGNTREFGRVIESLSRQITAQVGIMKAGTTQKAPKIPEKISQIIPEEVKPDKSQIQKLSSKVEKLGYTLRMKYLQNKQGDQAPDVFKAWLVDKDFSDPEKRTVDVRVLLTRNQLSDLHTILKQILDTAEKGVISPTNFISELKSLAATTSRDPEQLGGTTSTTSGGGQSLAELGFMREYLDGLPYTGDVMNLSLEDWQQWSVKRQIEFLQGLEDKINYYRYLHDHIDLWVSIKGGSIDGDSVFPVPLAMLP